MSDSTNTVKQVSNCCVSCDVRCDGFCKLLVGLSNTTLQERSQPASYKQNAEILLQGEKANSVGIIRSGLVKVVLLNEDGDHQVLQILKRGQLIGDPCKDLNAFSWEAATETDVCWIQRSTLDVIMREQPQGYRAYLEVITRQLEENRLWSASMRGRNTVQRIAYWLVQQVPCLHDGAGAIIQITLTRRDLASLLDMTVETLCRGLYQLSDRDTIRLRSPQDIELRNINKLRLLARCSEDQIHDTFALRESMAAANTPFCMSTVSYIKMMRCT